MPRGTETRDLAISPFRIGEWLVEPVLSRLTCGDSVANLEIRVMDVLVCLALNAPDLVTRKRLTESVWSTEFISDNTLTHAITEVRAALGDDARNPTYIETIHRRGYRLVVPVSGPDTEEVPSTAGRSFVALIDGDRCTRLSKGENVVGRLPWVSVTIKSLRVSRRHALVIVEEDCAFLEDLGSRNGTLLNGRPIDGRSALEDGDEIALGSYIVAVRFLTDATTVEADDNTPTDRALEA